MFNGWITRSNRSSSWGDADQQMYDRAILVSGDYDQIPAVRKVTKEFMRPVEVWLPPGQPITRRWKEFDGEERVSVRSIKTAMLERARLAIEAPTIWRALESSPDKGSVPSSRPPVVRRLTRRSS